MKGLIHMQSGISFFLILLVLLQSCVVYQKTPISLEQSGNQHLKTKISYANGTTAKFDHILFENGMYYGVTIKSGESISTPLEPSEINKVFIKNKSASNWTTVAAVALPVVALVIIVSTLPWGSWDLFPGEEF